MNVGLSKELTVYSLLGAAIVLLLVVAAAHSLSTDSTSLSAPKSQLIKSSGAANATPLVNTTSGGASNSSHTTVSVNGHSVEVGPNGSVDTHIEDNGQTTDISVDNSNSQTNSGGNSSNSQTSTTTVNSQSGGGQ